MRKIKFLLFVPLACLFIPIICFYLDIKRKIFRLWHLAMTIINSSTYLFVLKISDFYFSKYISKEYSALIIISLSYILCLQTYIYIDKIFLSAPKQINMFK